MRLIVARCEVSYAGRTSTVLGEAVRLLMCKADGAFMVWADGGSPSVKPINWMAPPTVLEEERDGRGSLTRIAVRRDAGAERMEIAISEVISESEHEIDTGASLAKEGVEREIQDLLCEAPHFCGEGMRLVRREWPTDIGPVDLMCRDGEERWVAIEVKRVAGIDAVAQLSRYLERIRRDPEMRSCRGILAAKSIKPQARVMAQAEGIDCVELDVEVLRGEREPELTLFGSS